MFRSCESLVRLVVKMGQVWLSYTPDFKLTSPFKRSPKKPEARNLKPSKTKGLKGSGK